MHTAAFGPDGQRIVTSSRDGVAAVWQADGGGEPVVLKGHEGVVWSAAFSPDGRRVVTASSDGTARVWRVTWNGVLEYLEANIDLCLEPEARMQFLGEVRSTATERFARCEHAHGRMPGRSRSSELQTSSVGVPGAGTPRKRP